MRVAIISSNGYLDKQVLRLLSQNGINGDIIEKITKQVVQHYDCLIVSHKNEIPNLPIILERIVLEKTISVIYISNTTSIGQFYNVYHDLYCNFVNEVTMEVELPVTLQHIIKYMKEIRNLKNENKDLKDQLETIQLTNKAKRILMDNGYSEADSHQYIQRKSMDLRVSKKQLVNLIIENKIDF